MTSKIDKIVSESCLESSSKNLFVWKSTFFLKHIYFFVEMYRILNDSGSGKEIFGFTCLYSIHIPRNLFKYLKYPKSYYIRRYN